MLPKKNPDCLAKATKSRTAESMVIVANNSTLQEFVAESKPVRPITRDFTVAYISLSESGYCRHKTSYVAGHIIGRSPSAQVYRV